MKTLALALVVACSLAAVEKKQIVATNGAKPAGPYSPGVLAGNYLYVTGQGTRDSTGKIPDTLEGQVRQSLENVKVIVAAAGLTMEHVVYSQVYLHQSVSYELMNKVWNEYFPKNPPARATLGVHRMPTDITVQINAVATTDLSKKRTIMPAGFPKDINIAPGMMVGDRLYISGLLGRDGVTGKIPDTPAAQVQLALDRVKSVLTEAGMDFRHMVFVNPYLTKDVPMGVMNKIYAQQFEFGNTPARATIEVSFLPHGANIEFTGVAIKDLSKRRAVRPKNMAPSATASPCVWADDTFYCSAKSGFIPGRNGGIFADNTEDQLRMTMRNLLDGLEEAEIGFKDVVATCVYLDNQDEFPKMNAVYGKYLNGDPPPTRSTLSPLAPVERKRNNNGSFPMLEQVSIIAVK
jgi:reactive intermediate/imine deaminase